MEFLSLKVKNSRISSISYGSVLYKVFSAMATELPS